LVEPPVVTGKGERQIDLTVEFMGCGRLHAVVGAEGKDIRKAAGGFHQQLAHFHEGEPFPALDQMGHGRRGLGPGDPAGGEGTGLGTHVPHVIGARLLDQQLDQSTGIAEQDHPFSPDPRSRSH
jgi:hypothetical protein